VVLLFVFVSAGLVVPAWFVGVLIAVWVAMAVVAIRKRADERYLVLAPIVAVALLIAAVSAGELLLDWTA
jgi:hypothetical protein